MRNEFKQDLKKLGVYASVKKADQYGKGCFTVSPLQSTYMSRFPSGAIRIIKKLAIDNNLTTNNGYPINMDEVAMNKFELSFRVAQ